MPINKGYSIPKSLPPTRAGVDRLRAQFQEALNRVMDQTKNKVPDVSEKEKSLENEALKGQSE